MAEHIVRTTKSLEALRRLVPYLMGIIVDSIGLTVGGIFLDDLVFKEKPSTDQKSCFWNKAGDHVLKYRDSQWAYYSCYRNLFILSALAIILFGVCLFKNGLVLLPLAIIVLGVALEVCIWFSMRCLLKLYYDITKCFN